MQPPPTSIDHPGASLAGVSIRTSNQAPAEIGAFWGRAIGDDVLGLRVAPRAIVAIYRDYASDWRGPYTMWLAAAPVAGVTGLSPVVLPPGRYACFAADGDPTVVVPALWQSLWTEWTDRERRTYDVDFEVHGARGPGTCDVHVGIR